MIDNTRYHTSPLVGSLHLYTDAIVLHRPDGATHCVDPLDVGAAMSALRIGTPLLPRNTLLWQRGGGKERIGVYVEPAVHPMWVKVGGDPVWSAKVPMPAALFVGQGTTYHIWALRGGWPAAEALLYAMPCPNVGGDGLICNGDVDFPEAGAVTIWAAVEAFFGSVFAGHSVQRKSRKFRDDVLTGWRELAGVAAWPEDDLVEAGGTVGEVIGGK